MSCITRVKGYGCISGSTPNTTLYDRQYPGKCTLVQNPYYALGTVSPRFEDGSFPPHDFFCAIVSVTFEGCTPTLNPNQQCDCVNGGCVTKATYNTPGVFPTLAACQAGCAKNSNCTGECVDPAEIAAHQQAINNLKAKIC